MDSKQIERTLRDASPTTRERLRGVLLDYQNILSSRISSMRSLAKTEEELRRRCGVPSRLEARKESKRAAEIHGPPHSKLVQPTPRRSSSRSLSTTKISSCLVDSRVTLNAPPSVQPSPECKATEAVVQRSIHSTIPHHSPPLRTQAPPPKPHASMSLQSVADNAAATTPSYDAPTSFTAAQDDLRKLFRAKKSQQAKSSLRSDSEINFAMSQLSNSMPDTSLTCYPVAGNTLDSLRLRNRQLRDLVATRIMKAAQPDDGKRRPHEPSVLQCDAGVNVCCCGDCADFAMASAERTLQSAFEVTSSWTNASADVPSGDFSRRLGALRQEHVLLRLRKVELLASRVHWQRMAWFHGATTEVVGGCSSALANQRDAPPAHDYSEAPPQAGDIANTLEILLGAWSTSHTLCNMEADATLVEGELRRLFPVLTTLSMLSELQWCVA